VGGDVGGAGVVYEGCIIMYGVSRVDDVIDVVGVACSS